MRAGGADPRRGIEIVGLNEGSYRRLTGWIEADDAVDGRRHVGGVVLADRDQSLMPLVEDEIGVPDVLGRRDGDGGPPRILPVEALVVEVGEPHGALARQIRPAAVLMHPVARVVIRRRDVCDTAVRTAPDDDIPAGLCGPLFDPIDVIAIKLDRAEANDPGHDRVRRDRRAPGAIGAGLLLRRHRSRHPRQGYLTQARAPPYPPPASGGG